MMCSLRLGATLGQGLCNFLAALGILIVGGGVLQPLSSPNPARGDFSGHRGRTISAQQTGALGDGQLATDCTVHAGSNHLICRSPHFSPGDSGKVIAVYGAGKSLSGFIQPLSSKIVSYICPNEVVLALAASNTQEDSERTVWGTDDSTSAQRCVDALATPDNIGENPGGTCFFPKGHYLIHGIKLPCSQVGDFTTKGYGRCTKAYNNIQVRGAGADATLLENWDVSADDDKIAGFPALITLGASAEVPGSGNSGTPNRRLNNIKISDLTLYQVKHASRSLFTIMAYATQNVEINGTNNVDYSRECIVMGGGWKSIYWRVHHNRAGPCGLGGPTVTTSGAALNLNGSYVWASNNEVAASGQGFELGGHDVWISHNRLDGTGSGNASPHLAINITSAVAGLWLIHIHDNYMSNWAGIDASNVLGILNRIDIENNEFLNFSSGIVAGGGRAKNLVVGREPPSIVHGSSTIKSNRFSFEGVRPVSFAITIGGGEAQPALESWLVQDNTLTFHQLYCSDDSRPGRRRQNCDRNMGCGPGTCRIPAGFLAVARNFGGGAKWKPHTSYSAGETVVPQIGNGYFYSTARSCQSGPVEPIWPIPPEYPLINDITCQWSAGGPTPKAMVINNRINGPALAQGFGRDVVFYDGANRSSVKIKDLVANYDLAIVAGDDCDAPTLQIVPAFRVYGDSAQYFPTYPSTGKFERGWQVIVSDSPAHLVQHWIATRAGYAAPSWRGHARYAFGARVLPQNDNGHFYLQTTPGSCTSAQVQPTFPAATGNTVLDGSCLWRESGISAGFTLPDSGGSP